MTISDKTDSPMAFRSFQKSLSLFSRSRAKSKFLGFDPIMLWHEPSFPLSFPRWSLKKEKGEIKYPIQRCLFLLSKGISSCPACPTFVLLPCNKRTEVWEAPESSYLFPGIPYRAASPLRKPRMHPLPITRIRSRII